MNVCVCALPSSSSAIKVEKVLEHLLLEMGRKGGWVGRPDRRSSSLVITAEELPMRKWTNWGKKQKCFGLGRKSTCVGASNKP